MDTANVNMGFNWSLSDYLIMGALLAITGTLLFVVWKKVKTAGRRLLLAGLVLLGFLYIWAELAVGIFTNLGS